MKDNNQIKKKTLAMRVIRLSLTNSSYFICPLEISPLKTKYTKSKEVLPVG